MGKLIVVDLKIPELFAGVFSDAVLLTDDKEPVAATSQNQCSRDEESGFLFHNNIGIFSSGESKHSLGNVFDFIFLLMANIN
jgi:hypothetical protein